MLGVFPLYYRNSYYDMGDAKYDFFKYVTIAMLCVYTVSQTIRMIIKRESPLIKFSRQDIPVLLYALFAALSFVISPFRAHAWVGSPEWYMGLLAQLLFVGSYFAVTRDGKKIWWNIGILIFSGTLVFIISYLHRFKIDPLGLYAVVSDGYWIAFLGTIGNANWYSSYICVVLPIVMGVYIFFEGKQPTAERICRVLTGISIFLGFATTVTQNSDSAYIGMAVAALFLLWFAMEKVDYFARFLETLLMGLLAAKITGCLQIAFPEQAMELAELSTEITQGNLTWYVLVLVFLVYIFIRIWKRDYIVFGKNVKKIRNIFFIMLSVVILAVPVLMWLVTTEKMSVDMEIFSKTGYLVFDDGWGTNRGKIWKYAIQIFREYPLSMKLFGCGPDALMHYTETFHHSEVMAFGERQILTNVHNEWLNVMINYGVFGAISYLAIFITCVVQVVKKWKLQPMLLAFGASVVSYMGHNFFCFQQVVCTSLIFIVIAMAECEIQKLKQ